MSLVWDQTEVAGPSMRMAALRHEEVEMVPGAMTCLQPAPTVPRMQRNSNRQPTVESLKGSSGTPAGTNNSTDWIDKEELRRRLALPSTRMIDELMKRRKIPFVRLGHRTVRFSWERVQAALSKFEHRAVGQ